MGLGLVLSAHFGDRPGLPDTASHVNTLRFFICRISPATHGMQMENKALTLDLGGWGIIYVFISCVRDWSECSPKLLTRNQISRNKAMSWKLVTAFIFGHKMIRDRYSRSLLVLKYFATYFSLKTNKLTCWSPKWWISHIEGMWGLILFPNQWWLRITISVWSHISMTGIYPALSWL